MKNIKLVIFDGDNTLWSTAPHDYVSQIESDFCIRNGVVVRLADQAEYRLRTGVIETLKMLKNEGIKVGIASDNRHEVVLKVLQLFNIWQYLDPEAVEIRLFDGYCPKDIMIEEILARSGLTEIKRADVCWIDDKDYSTEAKKIGIKFCMIKKDQNMCDIVKSIVFW